MTDDAAEKRARNEVIGCALVLVLALVLFVGGGLYLAYARHVRRDDRLRDLVAQHLSIEEVRARLQQDPGYRMESPRTWDDFRRLTVGLRNAHMPEVAAKTRQWPTVRAFTGPAVVGFVFFDAAGTAQDYVLSEK